MMTIVTATGRSSLVVLICVFPGFLASWDDWWSYDGFSGPSFWGLVNADWKMCSKGQHQSPININPNLLLYDPLLKPLTIGKTRVSGKLTNTGQFLLFEIENHSKNEITISGGPFTTYRYRLSKVIVRVGLKDQTGSEHAIDDEKFSGEVQVYGYNIDLYRNFTDAMKMPNGLAGLSAVIEIHSFTNPELKYFASMASDVMHKGRSIPFSSLSIHYLMPETSQYVTYEGSLTFPGCHESVTWLIMNKPVYINHKDMKMLRELQRSDEHASSPMYLGGGGRKLMALNRRVIRTNISFKAKSATCRSTQRRLLYKVNPWRKLNRPSN
uniref:Alpha-carbonic anhydrase domain-containing protein n=1 Tax=Trichuris muris TaxID=70415 RepID=A0A5S6QTG9_TRIMR